MHVLVHDDVDQAHDREVLYGQSCTPELPSAGPARPPSLPLVLSVPSASTAWRGERLIARPVYAGSMKKSSLRSSVTPYRGRSVTSAPTRARFVTYQIGALTCGNVLLTRTRGFAVGRPGAAGKQPDWLLVGVLDDQALDVNAVQSVCRRHLT